MPRQSLIDALDRLLVDVRDGMAQLGLGFESVEFRSTDHTVDGRCSLAANIGACKETVLSPERDAAQGALS